ncbi:MAG: hypothetical protein H6821_01580 [Planctomycetaceae bacterium]|nr:hypothetical protein [Planctomycetales bacterium]MCB9872843.1 hypothetical protein [Planctomycetaceae bacterium]MCB9941408.1 hypothetical protein [Planctomycetaceae bacterium]
MECHNDREPTGGLSLTSGKNVSGGESGKVIVPLAVAECLLD